MPAVLLVARASGRRRWRGLVVLTLLIGLAGAAVLASAAGARRTATSFDRFRGESRAADVELDLDAASAKQLSAFRRDPAVESVAVLRMVWLMYPGTGEPFPSIAAKDDAFGRVVDRARVLEGRLPRQASTHEIAISKGLAAKLGKGVGDTATFDSAAPAQIEESKETGQMGPPEGPTVHLDIVGIVRRPLDLGDSARSAGSSTVFFTPGFERRYRDEIGGYVPALLRVRTTDGAAGVPDAVRAARRIFGDSLFQVVGRDIETAGATDAIRVLTDALWIFAGVAALAGLTAIGIVTFRQIDDEERDQLVLSTLGLTARQRALAAGALGVVPAIVGGVLAVVGAVLVSPRLPFGFARQAEPDPGFHVDAAGLGLGLLAIVGFVLLVSAAAGWRVARSTVRARTATGPRRASTASRISFHARTNPAMTTGLRLALEPGRSRLAVPVRTAFVGATIGTLGIVAVLVFGASLDHLIASPRLYGWSWDASLQGDEVPKQGQSKVCGDVTTSATKDTHFSAVAATCREGVEIAGHTASGWSFTSLKGSIEPVVVAGRAPATPDEVALGRELLDTAGKRIGEAVRITGERSRRFRIVGQVVLPNLETIDSEPLAGGATFTGPGLMRIFPPRESPNTNILARFAPDVDPSALQRNRSGMWEFERSVGTGPVLPVEVARLDQVDQLPAVLAGLLALLALVAIGHAVVLAVHRRRRELAVLRTIGFTSRDVRATIAYQTTILTMLGLVVGIPLGLIVGRSVWRTIADGLGVAPVFSVSLLALTALVLGGLVIANAIGVVAANRAVHDHPAVVLAEE